MTDNIDETTIGRTRRRDFELGEGCLSQAKLEAKRLAQNLGRTPAFADEILVEPIAYLIIRSRTLRNWGLHGEADKATRLLAVLLKDFEKKSKPTVAKALKDAIY
jgi:hypothetical protein